MIKKARKRTRPYGNPSEGTPCVATYDFKILESNGKNDTESANEIDSWMQILRSTEQPPITRSIMPSPMESSNIKPDSGLFREELSSKSKTRQIRSSACIPLSSPQLKRSLIRSSNSTATAEK